MKAEDKKALRRAATSIVTLLIIVLAGVWLIKGAEKAGYENVDNIPDVPTQATLEGSFSCLPHRDMRGPVTQECAYGIKTDEGYFALDTTMLSMEQVMGLETAKRFRVTGLLVDILAISSNQWQKYNVEGIMRVETFEKLQ